MKTYYLWSGEAQLAVKAESLKEAIEAFVQYVIRYRFDLAAHVALSHMGFDTDDPDILFASTPEVFAAFQLPLDLLPPAG